MNNLDFTFWSIFGLEFFKSTCYEIYPPIPRDPFSVTFEFL
jgi:hypothetical protein